MVETKCRQCAQCSSAEGRKYMKILVAVDQESSVPIVDFLKRQDWASSTEFRVATVYDTNSEAHSAAERSPMPFAAERALGEKLEQLVDSTAARLKELYPGAKTTSCVLHGDVASALATESELWGADLVAIGSHHRRGIERWVSGSVSESVLHCSSSSMLIVPVKSASAAKV